MGVGTTYEARGPRSLDCGFKAMPLSKFQGDLGRLLAKNRSEDSYLAGGAALHAAPNSIRYSQDLDYFHDSTERVASAFAADSQSLLGFGCEIIPEVSQPGYIRVSVQKKKQITKIEWAHDSSWRFMPTLRSDDFGYQLHPVDLATNKILALAGRNEARDWIDTLHIHTTLLELGPLVWAAVGKDPGFSPLFLIEQLRRRGKIHAEDLLRLNLNYTPDLNQLKKEWLNALEEAESFVKNRPADETGCLYYNLLSNSFVNPNKTSEPTIPHYGRPGGVLPRLLD